MKDFHNICEQALTSLEEGTCLGKAIYYIISATDARGYMRLV
jgi:hypothetical protein